ncbi:enoyl-CoA hydratase-related protein [Hahella aquimaris]|uniref:enoyl-CoA hydratase/isomerase family protein n=1 Tax=Hahella sp. HNIBRBA332 TaxID=3015983 RepID=UPI00273CDC6E|nr:enoyl-CoA hydratase-related protein [Hahella sp. HNIBRBA332]WLQ14827.1 enoyl-CoA hydratase-related protein [Hahella sp. HNIBRBA332]
MTTLIQQTSVNGVTTLTINRPDKLNALSPELFVELKTILLRLQEPGFPVRGVILTGAGEKAFVAGADIAAMQQMSPEEGERFAAQGQEITALLEALPIPVIACVNGYALGGGCELAMACDFIYCTERAQFGQPEVSLGLTPCFGGCVRLSRFVGAGRARELIYTGRRIDAGEALRIGLVNRVFSSIDAMLAAARDILLECKSQSPVAISLCKHAINASYGRTTAEALEVEKIAFRRTFESADKQEGVKAFVEKRPAVFPGE